MPEPVTVDPSEIAAAVAAEQPADPANLQADGKPAPAPALPDGGYEKFYDAKTGAYNWQAHAVEAEYQRDQARGKVADPAPAAAPAAADVAADVDAQNAAAAAGLNWETLGQTLATHGNLTDADYAAFEKIGIPATIIEDYVANWNTARDARDASVAEYVGSYMGMDDGNAALGTLLDWAAANVDEQSKATLNAMLASDQWQTAVNDLMVRYAAQGPAQSAEPVTLQGAAPDADTGTGSVYKSMAEMIADQKNDLYEKNPDFRAAVEAKARRSPALRGPSARSGGALQGGGIIVGV